jgi:phytanoyl-CoA hydroxylase
MLGAPGSQKQGTLKFWNQGPDGMVMTEGPEYNTENGEVLEAEAGTAILLHGDFVHWSGQNTSQKERHAYTLHVVETHETTWNAENWLQRDNFRVMDLS